MIQEAKDLRSKLVEIKKKKEKYNSEMIRTELSELYNSKYEEFKKNIDLKVEDQLTSLELAREIRLTEIVDVENRLK